MSLQTNRSTGTLCLLALVLSCSGSSLSDGSATVQAEFDASSFGPILTWTPDRQIAGYRSIDRIYPTREIRAGEAVLDLPSAPRDLSEVFFEFEGQRFDLESFVEHNHIAGLLVLKDGEVALERYENGNTAGTKWVSFSIAKSVVSLLFGAAIKDGYISDLDASVTEYLPLLDGSAYEDVTIRHALQMASGVEWNEDYSDPDSDIGRTGLLNTLSQLEYLGDRPRVSAPGERFNYNTGEAHLVGAVLRAAIGNTCRPTYRARSGVRSAWSRMPIG